MMDNQYNYYRPDSDENRGAGNQQGFGAGPQKDPKTSKRRCDDAGNQLSDW